MRDRAAQDKAACLKADDLVDRLARIGRQQLVHRHAKTARIGEKRGHVAKQDPLMREIDDGADIILDAAGVAAAPGRRRGVGR